MGGGIGYFKHLLDRAGIAPKYHHIFYDFYLRTQNNEKLVFIDGGTHAGVFSDVALACGGLCYAFEPNIYLAAFLKNQYKDETRFILYQQALSNKNEKSIFYNMDADLISNGNSIISIHKGEQERAYEVQSIDFCEFVRKLLQKHGKINFVKLDIEGAEFELLDSLIEQNLYRDIELIMVETHERFFENPKEKINKLKEKIAKYEIKNIYLDWV
ncbi:FkbM family methyltransferase [Campylobacter sp. VTCC 70190]|uniref:FkbM family methyltransferase n=1 Tax=Campylobacter sp. VTCC 70190 TaxID=3392118 RepID=UPI00398ED67C